MKKSVPAYWDKNADWSSLRFYLYKMDTTGNPSATELPAGKVPVFGFLYVVEGEVLVETENGPHLCGSGQFLLVPPDTGFAVRFYSESVGYTGAFAPDYLTDASWPCLHVGRTVTQTFWFDAAAFVGMLLEQVLQAFKKGDDAFIVRAMDLLLSRIDVQSDWKAHPLVNRFMTLLFDHSDPQNNVADCAEQLHVSPRYLNRVLRRHTRYSAMRWIEVSRLNHAKRLLSDMSLSVGEVSAAVGIDDLAYFSRFFRKWTGLTPSQFRHQQMKGPKNTK